MTTQVKSLSNTFLRCCLIGRTGWLNICHYYGWALTSVTIQMKATMYVSYLWCCIFFYIQEIYSFVVVVVLARRAYGKGHLHLEFVNCMLYDPLTMLIFLIIFRRNSLPYRMLWRPWSQPTSRPEHWLIDTRGTPTWTSIHSAWSLEELLMLLSWGESLTMKRCGKFLGRLRV